MGKTRVRIQFNYGVVAIVVAIAIGFIIDGPWWGAPIALAVIPLGWLRARIEAPLASEPTRDEGA